MTDALGERMKAYERATRQVLPPRTYTIVRVDGRAFHTYCRGLERPFDARFAADMDRVTEILCSEISGAVFGYVQSDEISLLLTDFGTQQTTPWFGGVVAKMVSLSASLATATFNTLRPYGELALFDSRVFTISDPRDVVGYFVWRQRDAVKNSIAMAAQAHFAPQALHGKHSGQLQEMLFSEAGVNWNDYPAGFRRGRIVTREVYEGEVRYVDGRTGHEVVDVASRSRWVAWQETPHFTRDADGWLTRNLPALGRG